MKLFCAPLACSLLITGSLGATLARADMMPLAAHKAVYDLKMIKSTGGKALSDARTMIALEFSGSSCDGYASTFRQLMELTPGEGAVRQSEMRSVTFEDGEGSTFRFKVQSTIDGVAGDDLDGRAVRTPEGNVSVRLDRPEIKKSDLPDKAIFPTDHIRHIIAAAKGGEPTLAVKVFDGSDTGVKVFDTLAIIGKLSVAKAPESAFQVPELAEMAHWPVIISYFTVGKNENAPDYVLSFDLYEDGVARALKLDYGDFILAGDISKLEFLPVAACKN